MHQLLGRRRCRGCRDRRRIRVTGLRLWLRRNGYPAGGYGGYGGYGYPAYSYGYGYPAYSYGYGYPAYSYAYSPVVYRPYYVPRRYYARRYYRY